MELSWSQQVRKASHGICSRRQWLVAGSQMATMASTVNVRNHFTLVGYSSAGIVQTLPDTSSKSEGRATGLAPIPPGFADVDGAQWAGAVASRLRVAMAVKRFSTPIF